MLFRNLAVHIMLDGMKLFAWIFGFFRVWLSLCFALIFFVVPLYLIAIYPEMPQPYIRASRYFGYGLISGDPSALGFFYRLTSCGLMIALGLRMVWGWLRSGKQPKKRRDGRENSI